MEDATKEPCLRFRVEVDEREDLGATEVVSPISVAIPPLPFVATPDEDVKRLVGAIPTGKVKLVLREISGELKDAAECDTHTTRSVSVFSRG
jgi:hypothetical protein